MRVLYDGWSLVYAPDGAPALALLDLLEQPPAGIEPVVALPANPPEWFPQGVEAQVEPEADTPAGRLAWQQRRLGRLAHRLDARWVHLVGLTPALFGPALSLASPASEGEAAEWEPAPLARALESANFRERLRVSTARGGMARLRALFWPEDLQGVPPPAGAPQVMILPPDMPSGFAAGLPGAAGEIFPDLPDAYVLAHPAPGTAGLRGLLEAWGWATAALGSLASLVIAGLGEAGRLEAGRLAMEYGLEATVQFLPTLSPRRLPALYRGAAAVVHTGTGAPWGGPVRLALAAARPLAAFESPLVDAIVGPAAYLAPRNRNAPGGSPETALRDLAAALITLVIEEEVANGLSAAAQKRSAAWDRERFRAALGQAYRSIV